MKHVTSFSRNCVVVLCSAAALFLCGGAWADPPARVARLSQLGGSVSFSPAGEEDWVLAQANRPLVTGDRVWSDAGSHAELQIGTAAARLGANTSVALLNLDDTVGQFQVAQGTLNLRVRRIYGDQFFEVDTPNLAFSIRRAGDYRIDVDPSGNTTVINVRSGQGEAWGEGVAYTIDGGQQYTFVGEGLRDYRFDPVPPPDEFDRWCFDRNRREDAAVAARYVSPEVVGYSDLDDYGTWRNVEGYGNVWAPTTVAADWVPYHYGRWGWVDPWGWTWIDDAPWGFAPFHYGRWAYLSSRWCWVPGPIAVRPVYAPALVAFVGGGGFRVSIGTGPVAGIAWFPLGPGEVYRPGYAYSRTYFTNINVSNTVVNTTVINNVYNNNVTNIVYRNREAPGAITAVPAAAFSSAEPIARHAVPVSRDAMAREQITTVAAVTPSHTSVLVAGAAAAGAAAVVVAGRRPPPSALSRTVVARTAPPAAAPSFAAKASLLAAQPGKPLEAEKVTRIRDEHKVEGPKIKMVAPSVTPQPIAKGGAGKAASDQAGGVGQQQSQERLRDFKGPPQQGGQAVQDERFKERKGTPQGAPVPQPPAATQERMREFKGPPPQGGQAAQEEKFKERKGGPQTGGPQAAGPQTGGPQSQERSREFKGPPPPQGGQAAQEEKFKERKGGPQTGGPQAGGPQAGAPQTGGPQSQERIREFKGPPPQGGGQPTQEERFKERKGGPQTGGPQTGGPQTGGPQTGGPQAGEERFKERKGGAPQGGPVPQPPPQPQPQPQPQPLQKAPPPPQQMQKGPPPPPPPPQAAHPEPKHEEAKGKEKEKEKEKKEKEGQ